MSIVPGHSFDVRIWAISKYAGKRGTTYTVRWLVAGEKHQETFANRKLADAFRAELMVAARSGNPFVIRTGRPSGGAEPEPEPETWFDFARRYVAAKWPTASPRHRRGIAEALTTVTLAIAREGGGPRPEPAELRAALNEWAFGPPSLELPEHHSVAIAWIERSSPALTDLADPSVIRSAAASLAVTLSGKTAAPATTIRKRATLSNAMEYAVELGALTANPLRQIKLAVPRSDDAVDRRVVVNPEQARALLAAVAERDPALEGYFACLYYAGLRPAEARNLRKSDCWLPPHGWGRAVLTGSHQYSGSRWTDSGTADEERALKHRSDRSTRPVPLHPTLVETLRRHLRQFGTGADDRLFVTRTGRAGAPLPPPYLNPVSGKTTYRAWHSARERALSPKQASSILAKRPYDLRHACLSTWLNAGVSAAQVAEWAGHSIEVLLSVYTNCIDGEEQAALNRIESAVGAGATDGDRSAVTE